MMNKGVYLLIGFVVGVVCGLFIARRGEAPAVPNTEIPAAAGAPQPRPAERHRARADEPELRAAVESLEAMVSAVRSGLVYQQYLDRKVNAHIAVDHYLNARGQDAPLGITLKDALAAFDAAADLWAACIRQDGCTNGLITTSDPPPAIAHVFLLYPGLTSFGNPLPQDVALSYLWQEGTTQTAAARAAL
jgi:hypothetical protein